MAVPDLIGGKFDSILFELALWWTQRPIPLAPEDRIVCLGPSVCDPQSVY